MTSTGEIAHIRTSTPKRKENQYIRNLEGEGIGEWERVSGKERKGADALYKKDGEAFYVSECAVYLFICAWPTTRLIRT